MITNTELLKIKHALEGKDRRKNTKVRMKFPSAQKDDNHQGKILVIDDEVEFLDGLMDVLEEAGYSVDGVYNPTVAIEKLRKFLYDIVLLDLKMPRLDGLAILAEIRNISLYTCIIVVTGFGTVENAVTAMKMGAWDFITKPFEMEKLLNMLKSYVPVVRNSRKMATRKNRLFRFYLNLMDQMKTFQFETGNQAVYPRRK